MDEKQGRIIIGRVELEPYDVATLIAGITDENRHDAIDVGAPVGREAW